MIQIYKKTSELVMTKTLKFQLFTHLQIKNREWAKLNFNQSDINRNQNKLTSFQEKRCVRSRHPIDGIAVCFNFYFGVLDINRMIDMITLHITLVYYILISLRIFLKEQLVISIGTLE